MWHWYSCETSNYNHHQIGDNVSQMSVNRLHFSGASEEHRYSASILTDRLNDSTDTNTVTDY